MMNTPKIRFSGYTEAWEQRKFSDVFTGLQNNTLSRSELNYESGTVKNVHYGDVLIKFGGHELAAGFSVEENKIETVNESIEENASNESENNTPEEEEVIKLEEKYCELLDMADMKIRK